MNGGFTVKWKWVGGLISGIKIHTQHETETETTGHVHTHTYTHTTKNDLRGARECIGDSRKL